ncbi:MAG: hypothetical protein JOZ18_16180 [Chloroflexi bacterium]|nr:hypothetical protein [Chloroflexota bacterium]
MIASEKLTSEQAIQLLQRQDALQAEAQSVLEDLDVDKVLGAIGTLIQIGSTVLGLMVWPDIDFNVACPGASPNDVFNTSLPLLTHPRIKQVRYLNQSGAFRESLPRNDRYYFALLYQASGIEWKIDISFWLSNEPRQEAVQTEAILRQLTPETRLAILWIKDAWYQLPSYRTQVLSIDIYEAVLQHGVRTPAEFDAYLVERGKPGR